MQSRSSHDPSSDDQDIDVYHLHDAWLAATTDPNRLVTRIGKRHTFDASSARRTLLNGGPADAFNAGGKLTIHVDVLDEDVVVICRGKAVRLRQPMSASRGRWRRPKCVEARSRAQCIPTGSTWRSAREWVVDGQAVSSPCLRRGWRMIELCWLCRRQRAVNQHRRVVPSVVGSNAQA